MPVNPAGRHCRCGSIGCWETEVGEGALLRRAGRPADGGRDAVDAVLAMPTAGEPVALAALEETGRWLGIGLAGLVNLLNPSWSSSAACSGASFHSSRTSLEEELDRRALRGPAGARPGRPGTLGGDASLLGRGGARVRAVPRRSGGLAAAPRAVSSWPAHEERTATTDVTVPPSERTQRKGTCLGCNLLRGNCYGNDAPCEEESRMHIRRLAAVVGTASQSCSRRCSSSATPSARRWRRSGADLGSRLHRRRVVEQLPAAALGGDRQAEHAEGHRGRRRQVHRRRREPEHRAAADRRRHPDHAGCQGPDPARPGHQGHRAGPREGQGRRHPGHRL